MEMNDLPNTLDVDIVPDAPPAQNETEGLVPDIPPPRQPQPIPQRHPSRVAPNFDDARGIYKDDDLSFFDYVVDGIRGVGNGITQAVAETAETAVNLGANVIGEEEVDFNASDFFGENRSTVGDMVRDTTAFLVSFLGFGLAGKGLKAAGIATKLLSAGGKAGMAARAAGQGFLADMTAMDGMEAGFADLISGYEGLRHGIETAASQAKDSSDFEGRLQHGLEGLVIGTGLEFGLKALSKIAGKFWRKGEGFQIRELSPQEKSELAEELAPEREAFAEAQAKETATDPSITSATASAPTPQGESLAFRDITFTADEVMHSSRKGLMDLPKEERKALRDKLGQLTPEERRQLGVERNRREQDMVARQAAEEAERVKTGYADSLTDLPPKERAAALAREQTRQELLPFTAREGMDAAEQAKGAERLQAALNDARSPEEIQALLKDDYNTTTRILRSPEQFKVLVNAFEVMYDKTLKARGTESFAEAADRYREELKTLGADARGLDLLIKRAQTGEVPVKEVGMHITVLKNMSQFFTSALANMARLYDGGAGFNLRQSFDVYALWKNLDAVQLAERNLGTHTGRALNSFKHIVSYDPEQLRGFFVPPSQLTDADMLKMMEKDGFSRERMDTYLKEISLNKGNPAAQARAARKLFRESSWWHVTNEWRINNLLSSPLTWTANLAGNIMKTALMPAEKMLGGFLTGNDALVREGMDGYAYLLSFMSDSFNLAVKAWRSGDNLLARSGSKLEETSIHISQENFRRLMLRNKPEGTELHPLQEMLARAAGWWGPYHRIPSRIMVSSDEFFKQLNFRASLAASYARQARELGLNGEGIGAFVKERMKFAADSETGMANPSLLRNKDGAEARAMSYAMESTWTQELNRNSLGGAMEAAVNAHPGLRLVVPFIRTPVNIFRDFVAHTPLLGLASKRLREQFRAGGEARAELLGRQATGMLFFLSAFAAVQNGAVTGSPPQDPKARAALEATGWQPYSIRVGDAYFSYRRYDPIGMFFGIVADLAPMLPLLSEGKQQEAGAQLFVALTENLTSKTYMQGLAEVLDVINNPHSSTTSFFGRMGSTFIPFASALRLSRQTIDDPMREMRDFMDYLQNTVPGFSDGSLGLFKALPARRNWVTGDVVPYHFIGTHKNDPVLEELNRLADSVQGAPLETLHGVELSGEQYSRLLELHGTTRIGGRSMHEALQALIESPGYDVERSVRGDPPDAERGPRAIALRRIIAAYRERAQNALLMEDDALRQLVRQADYQRATSRSGTMTEDNQRELLDALVY